MSTTYTYKTLVRDGSAPTYKFAEVKYGKIVAFHEHWVPLEEFRNFFEAGALFLDVTGVKIEGEDPAIGDTVNAGANGYEIVHFKSLYSVAETKNYKIEMFKLERDNKEVEPVSYNGNLFDADKTSLTRLDKARQSLVDNGIPSITWTTADNQRVELTVADFAGINTALALRSNELHVRYNQLKAYINNIDGERYLPVILELTWDWDFECDLDEKLSELTAE